MRFEAKTSAFENSTKARLPALGIRV